MGKVNNMWYSILRKEEDDEKNYETQGERFYHYNDDGPTDTFVEGFGFLNKTEIGNWWKGVEQTFEEMLDNIGVGEGDTETYNKKMIKKVGHNTAAKLMQITVEEYITAKAKGLDDDEKTIAGLLNSPEIEKIMDGLLDSIEMIFSSIFDNAFESVRAQYDKVPNDDEVEEIDFDPDEMMDRKLVKLLTSKFEQSFRTSCDIAFERLEDIVRDAVINSSSGNGTDEGDEEKVDEITNKVILGVKKVIDEERENIMEMAAYVWQAFYARFPKQQEKMEEGDWSDSNVEVPRVKFNQGESEYEEKDEEGKTPRKKFEDEYKSNDQYAGELDWKSVLSKESGIGMSSNAGFSPAIHNITYSKKPCKSCRDKKSGCGCGK